MAENYFGFTDTGKQRNNNEDTFIAENVLNNRYIMACVVDGVGGYEGGEVAAQITREAILEYFSIPSGDVPTMLKESLMVANEKIHAEKLRSKTHSGMACVVTLAVVDRENNLFYYAHVGDTRLYLFRDHSLVKITKDHSFVGFLEDSGRLSEEAAMHHPKRNEINKALGFDTQIRLNPDYIETGQSPFLPGDILLLCSDGLSDLVNKKEITSILLHNKTLEEKAKRLIEAANNAGGKDNITVVLVHNNTAPLQQKATRPVLVKKNQPVKQPASEKTVTEKPLVNKPAEPLPTNVNKRQTNKTVLIVLAVSCALLFLACIWLLVQRRSKNNAPLEATNLPQSAAEKLLADSLQHGSGNDLILFNHLFAQPVLLSNTLFVQKDSLQIQGVHQTTFIADSTFKGPAFLLSTNCKYVLLENITFQNFDVAVLVQSKALYLKNVQFKNCRIPVQYQLAFPDGKYVSGSITDTSFLVTDSLSKTVVQ